MIHIILTNIKSFFSRLDFELIIWLSALLYLTIINPYETGHFQFCGFKLLGIENCPGCGLGKSISMIFHGDLINSFHTHWFGIPALLIIIQRIVRLLKKVFNKFTLPQEVLNG